MSKKRKVIKLKANKTSADLGRLTAEDDTHLADYYVGRDRFVDRALNMDDQASFFMGPKGAGKSAILQMVRIARSANPSSLIIVSPTQLAFSALANTNIASPLLADPHKKQWLYKSLWDYIIATEVGGREFIEENAIISMMKSFVRGRDERHVRRLLSLKYDENGKPESLSARFMKLIKEIELTGGGDVEGFKIEAKAKLEPSEWETGKNDQFKLLGMIHEVSSRLADTIKNNYYIIIDDLDIDWHNGTAQNDIIAAMFSSLRKVCRPPHLKCVVSIQDRIFRALPFEHKDKFRDALCNVDWDGASVKLMIEERVKCIIDIPSAHIWNGFFPVGGFEYIWSRTGGRPREAIRFASLCIDKARRNSHSKVEHTDMKFAFKDFSNERLEDISSELEYVYPSFLVVLRLFSGYPKEFPIIKIKDAIVAGIVNSMDDKHTRISWLGGYEHDYIHIAQLMLENQILLYKNGRSDTPQLYSPSEHDLLNENAYVSFHPMYSAGLALGGYE